VIRIHITSDALEDLKEGFLFYEGQEEGLGDYFSDSLKSDVESLKVTGGVHRLAYRDYRRLPEPDLSVCDLLHDGGPDRDDLGSRGLQKKSRVDQRASGVALLLAAGWGIHLKTVARPLGHQVS
jgi:hypothetical protein